MFHSFTEHGVSDGPVIVILYVFEYSYPAILFLSEVQVVIQQEVHLLDWQVIMFLVYSTLKLSSIYGIFIADGKGHHMDTFYSTHIKVSWEEMVVFKY